MKIEIRTDSKFKTFQLHEMGDDEPFAFGVGTDLHTATELQRRVNNYDDLANALRDILRTPSRAGVIASQALFAAREG